MSKAMEAAACVQVLPDRDGARVIVCSGEFDLDSEAVLRQALETAKSEGATRTVVDLAGVSFADSSMLNTLIRTHHRQHLVLAGPLTPQVTRLLEITGVDAVLNIAADTADAIATRPADLPR
ncbi:MAG TPA: STAS domain-containing protein [Streptomyces sp.]|nr:STAS domain-containing protein [Streptomyces sp.]